MREGCISFQQRFKEFFVMIVSFWIIMIPMYNESLLKQVAIIGGISMIAFNKGNIKFHVLQ
ncbi:hypothetical protein BK740_17570 [Bacillus thuringiensis serovar argentinensis]|nr:hypothetical protein BK740_17570 [Bacillus thuringiensis serovar argentinensis]